MADDLEWKLRLIEEVRKRPPLWDLINVLERNPERRNELWVEIGQVLNAKDYICKQTWTRLRAQFRNELSLIKKRVADAKEKGSYDSNKKYYTWCLFDTLRFILDGSTLNLSVEKKSDIETVKHTERNQIKAELDDSGSLQAETGNDIEVMESDKLDQKTVHKFRLIEEVRKRPPLWDLKDVHRPPKNSGKLWREIGQILEVNANTCRQTWLKLRGQFRNEAYRISIRIAKAKKAGTYNPNKKYYYWLFFDALRFLTNGLSPKSTVNLSFGNDSRTERVEDNNTDRSLGGGSSLQIESDDTKTVNEFIGDDCLDQPKNYVDKDFYPEGSPIIVKTEDAKFNVYTVTMGSCVPGNECATTSNHNSVLQIDSIVKEEPELQIEVDVNPLKTEDLNELQAQNSLKVSSNKLNDYSENSLFVANIKEEFSSSPTRENCVKNAHQNPSTFSVDPLSNTHALKDEDYGLQCSSLSRKGNIHVKEEFISSPTREDCVKNENPAIFSEGTISTSPDLDDENYGFLCSFLSQMKTMTEMQKMEFKVNMQKLLADTFAACSSINILEEQPPEDHDPDRKFLISFWPVLKSLSVTQNSDFRVKMIEVLYKIFSTEKNP